MPSVSTRSPWPFIGVALLVAAGSLFVSALLFVNSSAHTDAAIRAYSRRKADVVDQRSRARAIAVCERGNVTRAYLLLRAQEFVKTDTAGPSYTTKVSPVVLSILDCGLTERNAGLSVPLAKSVQARYLWLFARQRVGLVQHGRIVGSLPFAVYFAAPLS